MKKVINGIVLLFTFTVIASVSYAQSTHTIGFEGPDDGTGWAWTTGANGDDPALEFIANPDKSGLNTTDSVAKFTARSNGESYALVFTNSDGQFTFDADNNEVKIMVWKSRISEVAMKFEGVDAALEIKDTNTVTEQWEELTFDFSSVIGNTYTRMVIIPDFAARTEEQVVYFDNIQVPDGVVPEVPEDPTVSAPAPAVSAENVVSIFSDEYDNIDPVNYNPNWGQSTVATAELLNGNTTWKLSGLNYQGIDFDANRQDVSAAAGFDTSTSVLRFDYWTDNSTSLKMFPIWDGGEFAYTVADVVQEQWVTVEIPLSYFVKNGADLSTLRQLKVEGNGTVWMDNILFSKVSPTNGQYPRVSVKDVQYVPDEKLALDTPEDASQFVGDTVVIKAIVVQPSRKANGKMAFFTGNRYRFVVMDYSAYTNKDYDFAFITGISQDTTEANTTGAGEVQRGMIFNITGYITEYRSLTQFEVLNSLGPDAMEFLGFVDDLDQLPGAIEVGIEDLNVGTFTTGSSANKNWADSEKYESALVKLTNATVVNSGSTAEVVVEDASGNQMLLDDQGDMWFSYFNSTGNRIAPIGSTVDSVLGWLFTKDDAGNWSVNPVDTNSVYVRAGIPPTVDDLVKSKVFYSPNEDIVLTATFDDPDGVVDTAIIYLSVDNGMNFTDVGGVEQSENVFQFTVEGGYDVDSALVQYYIIGTDNDGLDGVYPTVGYDAFWVLNRGLGIREVQYTVKANGSSLVVGDSVTVSGVVTSSQTDLGLVHIQDGNGPWSGLNLNVARRDSLQLGDRVTVTGLVQENFGLTRMQSDNLSFTVDQTGLDLPAAEVVNSEDVRTGADMAEAYEGVLIRIDNAYVTSLNADAATNSNFGEILISEVETDASGLRVDDQSSKLPWANDTTRSFNKGKDQYVVGQKFAFMSGVLTYTFSNYKMLPRDARDFGDVLTSVRDLGEKATSYVLEQNYPNPFNPSTTIKFSLAKSHKVTLEVYNMIGQRVAILINGQELSPSSYSVDFNATSLSSGLYFYRLTVDNEFIQTKKMVLLK